MGKSVGRTAEDGYGIAGRVGVGRVMNKKRMQYYRGDVYIGWQSADFREHFLDARSWLGSDQSHSIKIDKTMVRNVGELRRILVQMQDVE